MLSHFFYFVCPWPDRRLRLRRPFGRDSMSEEVMDAAVLALYGIKTWPEGGLSESFHAGATPEASTCVRWATFPRGPYARQHRTDARA